MKITLVALVACLTILSARSAHADPSTGKVTIESVSSTDSGKTCWIRASSNVPAPGCSNKSAVFDCTAPETKNIFSTAVAAFLAGKPVYIFYSGCLTRSGVSRPRVTGIQVEH